MSSQGDHMTKIDKFSISGDGTIHVDKSITVVHDQGPQGSISLIDGVLRLGKGAKVVVEEVEPREDKDDK